jgi:Ca2+-binding EF-hand superfamily protein
MKRKTVWILAGVALVAGGATAIAAVGDREGGWGRRGMHHDMAQDDSGGRGEGPRGRFMHGRRGEQGDEPGERRGWGSWRGVRSMTADQFDARTRERFARLDKNSDGVIDSAEAEAAIEQRRDRGRRLGERMRQRFAHRFDGDRDGKVTRQEFVDRVGRMFDRMDLNGDGRITDDDLPPMMRGRDMLKGEGGSVRRGPMGGRLIGRLIEADANKDGIITREEALAEAGKRFDRLDRNKDGALDQADRDAMQKETTSYRVQRFMHNYGAVKEGKVTREQFFKSAKERFAQRDVNSDGRIDRNDFGRGRQRGADDRRGSGGRRGGPDRTERGTTPETPATPKGDQPQ